MSRINTNVAALISSRRLNQNNRNLNISLERLSTGYRINRGSDNPAGLIASENLRSDMAAIKSALTNAERANSVVATAEGALAEVSNLLVKLQGLAAQSANTGGLTTEEIGANQLQVDSIIGSIDRIASQTSFEGKRLLDGSMGFETTTGAGDDSKISDIVVNAAKTGGTDQTYTVTVDTAATQAVSSDFAAIDTDPDDGSVTYEITGKSGSVVLTFAHGATTAQIKDAVNAVSSITGLYVSTDNTKIRSKEFTSDDFVRVKLIAGAQDAGITVETKSGSDPVVSIDGQLASVNGYKASLKNSMLDIAFNMTDTLVATAADTEDITVTDGGGATFQISQNIGYVGREVLGIQSMYAAHLGQATTGYVSDIASGRTNDLATDARGAQEIISAAIKQVATLRGRLGSFIKDTVQTTMNSLNVAYENVAAADAAIRETDFATETAALTRNQILVNASTSVLGLANTAPQSVLALLG